MAWEDELSDRIAPLETMPFLPAARVPGDLTGRLWKLEDQLQSFGAVHPAYVTHLPVPDLDAPLRREVIEARLEILEHLYAHALKGGA